TWAADGSGRRLWWPMPRGESVAPMADEPVVYPPCRCGREMRKLNGEDRSPWPRCVGCGFDEENCRCLIAGVIGIGCPPDCDHAHAEEPSTEILTYLTAKVTACPSD